MYVAARPNQIAAPIRNDTVIQEFSRDTYCISTDRARLDLPMIHGFLSRSYWSEGITMDVVMKSIEHSLPYGVYCDDRQVGFARVITDYSTFAYIADVFILEAHRGIGLAKWLMECILAHPELNLLKRWMLVTRDAQALYGKFGFAEVEGASGVMAIRNHDVYREQ